MLSVPQLSLRHIHVFQSVTKSINELLLYNLFTLFYNVDNSLECFEIFN